MSTNSKTYEVGEFILDSIVPEIIVPIMKPSRRKPFEIKKWINNATTEISKQIIQKNMEKEKWILNAKIEKYQVPSKIKNLVKLVLKSRYSDVEMSHNYKKKKLSV